MNCEKQKRLLPLSFHVFLQEFIYFMNESGVRDDIIRKRLASLEVDADWLGSWNVQGEKYKLQFLEVPPSLSKSGKNKDVFTVLQKKLPRMTNGIFMFTVCYHYEDRRVHYVSFVYDAKKASLKHFDPGISLYLHGQETLVPSLYKIFNSIGLIDKSQEVGECLHQTKWKGKIMGIQFDGNTKVKLPADAFCQTWTVFFLIRSMVNNFESESFVETWCSIRPRRREAFLISNFVLPFLLEYPRYYKRICRKTNSTDNFIKIMYDYVEACM